MQKGVNRFLLFCLTFIFLIGVVSAWNVDITKLNNNALTNYSGVKVTKLSYQISGINCDNITGVWYTLDGGATNNSLSCGTGELTLSGLSSNEYNNTWAIYASDDSNTTNSNSVAFWIDSILPLLAVLNPLGNIGYTNTNTLNLLAQLTETNKGGYFGSGVPDNSFNYIWREFVYPNGGSERSSYLLNSTNVSDASLSPSTLLEGNYTFTTKARDKYPNGSTIREVTKTGIIIRDTLFPITSITSPTNGNWYAGIVNIISSAVDNISVTTDVSGVNNITLNITNGTYSNKSSSSSSPFNYNWNSTLTPDGNYTIEIVSYDRAGNSNLALITIKTDNTMPTITNNYTFNGTWINNLSLPQIVKLTPGDGAGSGINNVKYCEGFGCTPNILLNPNPLYQLNYTSDQNTTVRYQTWDNVTNPSLIGEYNVKIDTTAPTTNNNALIGWRNSNVSVTLFPTDALSGVANTSYCVDQNNSCVPGILGTNILVSTEGINYIRYFSIDNAINTESTKSIQVWIDKTRPSTNNNALIGWQTSDFNVSLSASDNLSGISYINYSYNNGTWQQVFGNSTTILINQEGNLTLEYYAVDNAGNIEIKNTIYVALDKTLPTLINSKLSSNIFSPNNSPGILDNLTITMNSSELVNWGTTSIYDSNGNNIKWSTDPLPNYVLSDVVIWDGTMTNSSYAQDGVYTINTTITDQAGNIAIIVVGSVIVDNTNPSLIINSPLNMTNYTTSQILLNISASDINLGSVWFGLNGTNTTYLSPMNMSFNEGINNLYVWANDSAGNKILTSALFFKDSIIPLISFTTGTQSNNSYVSKNNIFVNVSVTEINEDTINFSLYNSTNDLINSSSFTNFIREINWVGLVDGKYYYKVTINDVLLNSNSTETRIITLDTTIPTLSGISATLITTSSASIIWTTNENANSNVSHGTTILTTSNSGSTTFESSHSISLSSLSASTLYYYNVSSCDASGNCNTSTQYSFTTSAQDGGDGGAGGGSSGGSGGGSSINYYACSNWADWSVCNNSLQTRTCLNKALTTSQKGIIASKFNEIETQACSALTPLTNPATEKTGIVPIKLIANEKRAGFIGRITGGITGAVTGLTKLKGGKISLIVIAILALAFALSLWGRKINRQKTERKIKIIHKSDLEKRNFKSK